MLICTINTTQRLIFYELKLFFMENWIFDSDSTLLYWLQNNLNYKTSKLQFARTNSLVSSLPSLLSVIGIKLIFKAENKIWLSLPPPSSSISSSDLPRKSTFKKDETLMKH